MKLASTSVVECIRSFGTSWWFCGAFLLAVGLTVDLTLQQRKAIYAADVIELLVEAEQACIVEDARIIEASGIARSGLRADSVWLHNDSGDIARLFLVNVQTGQTEAVLRLPNEEAIDWEDMCSFVWEGTAWLMVADIGDNAKNRGPSNQGGKRPTCRLLLFREPVIKPESTPQEISADVYGTIEFTYEGGARDCESVAVDTDRKEILLVSKSKSQPLDCGLYRIPLSLQKGSRVDFAEKLNNIGLKSATSMDISSDNLRMVIVSSFSCLMIERLPDESWSAACSRRSQSLRMPQRKQGETVCFTNDRNVILVNSEHPQQPLWRIKLPSPLSDPQS